MTKINVVGPQIRRFRLEDGLAQEELSARCGVLGWHVTRGTLAKIESQVRRVTDGELFILAAALRRPVELLFSATRKEIVAQLRQADVS
jgi:transcriptional regulator with XRE-family HTH domain